MARLPKTLHGFVGQRRNIRRLESLIEGSKKLGRALPCLLFQGRPGVGKTALGHALATEFGTSLDYLLAGKETCPEAISAKLLKLSHADFLFIDEAHLLRRSSQALLLPAITERRIPLPATDKVELKETWASLADFTLIVATNMPCHLAKALRDRLRKVVFEAYTVGDLRALAQKTGQDEGIEIKSQAARRIAEVAAGSKDSTAGTPRSVGHLVDELIVHLPDKATLHKPDVEWVFTTILGIDEYGLWPHHRDYLMALRGGSCSLVRLAIMLGRETKDLMEDVEPPLFLQGLIEVCAGHGRMLTTKGQQVVADFAPPPDLNQELDQKSDAAAIEEVA